MRLAIVLCTALTTLWSTDLAAAGTAPTIAAAVVEDGESTQSITLAITPDPGDIISKVVCARDSIRVRFDGIAVANREIKNLTVSNFGPMRRARVIPRMGDNAVVQIFTRGRSLAACSRINVMKMDGNVVIAIALTEAEMARRDKIARPKTQSKEDEDVAAKQGAALSVGSDEDNDSHDKAGAQSAMDKKESKQQAKGGLWGKKAKSKTNNSLNMTDAEGDDSRVVRYAGGFFFAAMIAGVAWWVRRKKKRPLGISDEIEILSSKRLSSHQTLMVASVQGTKFLLAVGDKTVSSMGVISGGAAVQENLQPDLQSGQIMEQLAKSMRSEMSTAPQPVSVQPTPQTASATTLSTQSVATATWKDPRPHSQINDDFRRELESALSDDTQSLDRRTRADSPTSNVAGLISMARMRADLNKMTRESSLKEI